MRNTFAYKLKDTTLQNKSGVYAVKLIDDGRIYIGQSVNIDNRLRNHLSSLRHEHHHNKYLQNAFNKYGENSFSFSIIEMVPVKDLDDREKYWISELSSDNPFFGFNLVSGGNSNKTTPQIVRIKISNGLRGRILTYDTRKKISDSRLGMKFSDSHKAAIRKSKTGVNNPGYGKKRTEKTRLLMSIAQKGKVLSAEHRANISKAMKGRSWSERRRLSATIRKAA